MLWPAGEYEIYECPEFNIKTKKDEYLNNVDKDQFAKYLKEKDKKKQEPKKAKKSKPKRMRA